MIKRILLILLLFTLLSFSITPTSFRALASAGANTTDPLNMRAEAAILVDGQSGRILYAKNPDQILPTASMAKMMTEYLTLEAIKKGRIKWNEKVQISDYAHKVSQNTKLSNVPLRTDKEYTVKELYEAMAIYSANGATIALAEQISGPEIEFVKLMNQKARDLGLKNYLFVNCSGLNNNDLYGMYPANTSVNDENMMSARATATLAYSLIRDYPEVFMFSSIPRQEFQKGTSDEIKMDNWNWMLPELVFGYPGMDGLKTGSTDQAGYSFTGTAKRNGIRFISVVMKTNSFNTRFSETKKLLDYGFKNYIVKEILPPGQEYTVKVENGRRKKIKAVNENPLRVLVKRDEENLYDSGLIIVNLTRSGAVKAPLAKGAVVGRVVPKYKGEVAQEYLTGKIRMMDGAKVVSLSEVKKAGFFFKLYYRITDFIAIRWTKTIHFIAQKLSGSKTGVAKGPNHRPTPIPEEG
jgi:D-alanyl-D-alanine carboxypeptidase (penicillin-binding protein 5/6)